MRRRIKSERLAYVRHPVMERLIILFLAVPLYMLAIPWLFIKNRHYYDYLDSLGKLLGPASALSALIFLVLLVVYVFLNMRPQDCKGKDASFNLATAFGIEFVRSLFKFLVLGLFAPITIFLIRADFEEECGNDISDSYRL